MLLFGKNKKEKVKPTIDDLYAGRFFYKEVESSWGGTATIRVDKVELTEKYQSIIHDVELEVASKFLRRQATESDLSGWYEEIQLPMYAGVCDIYWKYYAIKQKVLKQHGIEWLSYMDLNPL